MSFHVWVGASPDICKRVKDGSADIEITYSFPTPLGSAIQRVVMRPIYAVVGKNHPLAGRDAIALDDLRDEPLAVHDQSKT